jgi:hypothetical protein
MVKKAITDYDKQKAEAYMYQYLDMLGVPTYIDVVSRYKWETIELCRERGFIETPLYPNQQPKRVPMSIEDIKKVLPKNMRTSSRPSEDFAFIDGIRAAEKHHGVTE